MRSGITGRRKSWMSGPSTAYGGRTLRSPATPYPFRFMDADLVHDLFPGFGLDVTELELSCRTYNRRGRVF